MTKTVKCRKEHTCLCCERKIEIGESALLVKSRSPTYSDEDCDTQSGVWYETFYMCKKVDCDEIAVKLEEKQLAEPTIG